MCNFLVWLSFYCLVSHWVRFFQEPTKYFDMRYNSKQIYYLQNHSDYFKITKSYTLSDNPELPLGNPMYNNRLQNITQSNPLLIHRTHSASSHPTLTWISSHQISGFPSHLLTTCFPSLNICPYLIFGALTSNVISMLFDLIT